MRYWLIIVLAGLFSCNQGGGSASHPGIPAGPAADTPAKSPVVPRNTRIDAGNSYSDLFFDSSKLVDLISKQQLPDSVATSIRNFYNNRNYQFAWFAGDGPTEQALAFSSLYNYSKDSSTDRKWLDDRLDTLLSADSLQLSATDPALLRTELFMTWRFVNYCREKENDSFLLSAVPAQKYDALEMDRAVVAGDLRNHLIGLL
jgi:hypothetical protein